MPRERLRVVFSGRVQGVGFRFTARDLAQRHRVVGFVRNLDDGGVELLAEAEDSDLGAFLQSLRAAFGAKIYCEARERESAGDPPFTDFSIRY